MKRKLILIAILFGAFAARAEDDPFRDVFFPPELIMQNQQALGLTEDQRNSLRSEILKAQTAFTELQWKLQDEMEKLLGLVRQQPADERRSLAQLDRVLAEEREVKRAQVTLMLRIRNALRTEQVAKLKELQARARSGR
jgi:Spy/CpxP family protein refolding chaperone